MVGILDVFLVIPGSNSLKDKRQVIKSILANVRNKFNVSAAEMGELDSLRRSHLEFAVVSNSKIIVNSSLDKILEYIESNPLCEVIEKEWEIL